MVENIASDVFIRKQLAFRVTERLTILDELHRC